MAKERINKINEEVRRELSNIVRELKDSRIPMMTSIVAVRVTNDLSYAKVYVSVFNSDQAAAKKCFQAIESAGGFIRREVGSRILIRYTPQLHFVMDDSIEYGVRMTHRIEEVLGEAEKENQ